MSTHPATFVASALWLQSSSTTARGRARGSERDTTILQIYGAYQTPLPCSLKLAAFTPLVTDISLPTRHLEMARTQR